MDFSSSSFPSSLFETNRWAGRWAVWAGTTMQEEVNMVVAAKRYYRDGNGHLVSIFHR